MSQPSVPPPSQGPPPGAAFGSLPLSGPYQAPYAGGGFPLDAYNQPPQQPPVPPRFGGPRAGRGRLALIIGSALAALVLIGGGIFALLQHDGSTRDEARSQKDDKPAKASPKPPSTDGKVLFRVPAPKAAFDDLVSAQGSWVTSKYYASGAPDAVKGYDAATGKPAWTVPLSGNICESSRDITSSGKVAVVFAGSKKKRSRCTEFAVIDVNKGIKVWHKSIPEEQVSLGLGLNVGISEDIAAAGWPGGSVGYQVNRGKQLWDAPPQGCAGEEHLGRQQLLTLVGCRTSKGMQFRVEQRSPDTGKATWRYTLPRELPGAWIVSADPLVLAVKTTDEALDADRLLTITESGSPQATIDIGDDYVAGCADDDGTCDAIVTTRDTIYIASNPHNFRKGNQIAAFDVRTGKRKWASEAPENREFVPVRAEGDGLVAYMEPTSLRGSRIVHFTPEGGQQTLLMKMPDGIASNKAESLMFDKEARDPALFEHGRLYLHYSGSFNQYTADTPMTLVYGSQ